jgi:hypothetical protein
MTASVRQAIPWSRDTHENQLRAARTGLRSSRAVAYGPAFRVQLSVKPREQTQGLSRVLWADDTSNLRDCHQTPKRGEPQCP